MQPRPTLRWLWTAWRVLNLGYGVLNARVSIADYAQGGDHYDHEATAALSATCLLIAALASPRNRGRLHRRLGRLGGRGSEAEEAAAIAALVGGHDSDAALERASNLLRCLSTSRLHATDLADSTTAPPAGPTLYERTEPAAMGEVTAFLSHSWSDEKEAPGAKHAVVSRWAKRRREKTGEEPTLWLVWRSPNWIFTSHTCMLHKPTLRTSRRRRTRRASTRATSSNRSPACPSSSRAARRCSSWLGPRTAQDCGASWNSSRLLAWAETKSASRSI